MVREIVRIDEELCDGCGECVPTCAEGALQIIDGKARLVADNLCDGLGACLGHCPRGAIIVEQREADEFDEAVVAEHLQRAAVPEAPAPTHGSHHSPVPAHRPAGPPHGFGGQPGMPHGGGCPSARLTSFGAPAPAAAPGKVGPSQLRQWPVQFHLVPPTAPFLQDADLLLAADCVPFSYPDFHQGLLAGKALLVGCPKLDDTRPYADKLLAILQHNDIRRLTVAVMEVPCCSGFVHLARQAVAASGKDIPLEVVVVGIRGNRLDR